MAEITLQAEPREITGKRVRHLRREGFIPAVLYGHSTKPVSLKITERALRETLRQAGGHKLITLHIGNKRKPHLTLVKEVQQDAISGAILHVDLQEVVMTETITTEVPLVFVGASPFAESGEGLLVRGLDSIEIECLPSKLISAIEVDLSALVEVDQVIHVADLKVDEEVKVLTDPEELVAQVLKKRMMVEEEEVEVEEEVPEVEVVARRPERVEEELEEEEEGEEEPEVEQDEEQDRT
ncbi:MAG: 50S ribosomal protein L25 [Anaerolineae bacterium]